MLILRRHNGLATTIQPLRPLDYSCRVTICPLTVFKSLCYPSCSCLYRTKLINVVNKCVKKVKVEKSEAIVEQNVHVRVLITYIFEVQMCMFGYLKTPDIILPLVSSRKLDWTHTFDTHCMYLRFTLQPKAELRKLQ